MTQEGAEKNIILLLVTVGVRVYIGPLPRNPRFILSSWMAYIPPSPFHAIQGFKKKEYAMYALTRYTSRVCPFLHQYHNMRYAHTKGANIIYWGNNAFVSLLFVAGLCPWQFAWLHDVHHSPTGRADLLPAVA